MFGGSRRHRPPAQPLTRETANPNAATAAASAFMRRDPPTPSLSSAAAAAALRARPTTPTNVAEVPSKRAMRRSRSVSSTRGRDSTRGSDLQRTPSAGSMTERTFRSPSPSPARGPAPVRQDVPPVPSIPREQALRATAGPPAHKKSASLSVQPFRTASQKQKDGQRASGSWFGAATTSDSSNVRRTDAVLRSPVSPPPEPRPSSVASGSPSVNFSYPRSQLESPTPNSRPSSSSDQTLVFDANSRRMVPRAELLGAQLSLREPPPVKPVKKKKQSQDLSRSGSHLSKGTVARTKGTVGTPPPAVRIQPPKPISATTTVAQQEPATREPDVEEGAKSDLRPSDGATVLPPSDTARSPTFNQRSSRPSIVHEEPEPEDDQEVPAETSTRDVSHVVDAVPVQSSTPGVVGTREAPSWDTETRAAAAAPAEEKPVPAGTDRESSIRRERVHSESPARIAHFGPTTDQLVVRHEPPPRSLSPRKSAMKHASPPRGSSPSDDSSEFSGTGVALTTREEPPPSRKKSVRVSFNDESMIVGESAEPPEVDSPMVPSPQSVKKPWPSILSRQSKTDTMPLDGEETMTPRPALPLFGSVREKKAKEPEERPLVRPSELAYSPAPATISEPEESPAQAPSADVGQSSDQVIGALLAQEQQSRNAANISKYREPLPPVVTSVEGEGYHSPSSSEDEMDYEVEDIDTPLPEEISREATPTQETVPDEAPAVIETEPIRESSLPVGLESTPLEQSLNDATVAARDFADTETEELDNVPIISISHPSPLAKQEEDKEEEEVVVPKKEYFGIPGGFPEEEESPPALDDSIPSVSEETHQVVPPPVVQTKTKQPEVVVASMTPTPSTPAREIEPVTPSTVSPQMDKIREQDTTEESEVFSDAYEDLSDVDGDGFMSLDAVLTTPVKAKVTQQLFEEAIAAKSKGKAPELVLSKDASGDLQVDKAPGNWEHAKAYWKSLSAEKRRQLEIEAMEEAGEEADLESDAKKQKTKKRRSTDRPKAVDRPAAADAPVETRTRRHPERTYQIEPGTIWSEDDSPRASPQQSQAKGPGSRLRKSMREQQPVMEDRRAQQTPHMRTSMRPQQPVVGAHGGPQTPHIRESMRSSRPAPATTTKGGMRTSMRGEAAPRAGSRKQKSSKASRPPIGGAGTEPNGMADRPVSYHAPTTAEPIRLHRRTLSNEDVPPTVAAIKPTLRRRGSDTSESSFQRVRLGTSSGFGFRRTMRGAGSREQEYGTPDAPKGSGRFSLRSLSPPSSPFRRNSTGLSPPHTAGGTRMRASMRSDSSDNSVSHSRFPSFGRSSGKKATKPPVRQQGTRFGDSSDEEDVRPAFRSRFADSSDEEDGLELPSGGQAMPRTMRSGASSSAAATAAFRSSAGVVRSDSPDLPDSDDEIVQPKRVPSDRRGGGDTIRRTRSGRGTLLAGAPATAPGAIGTDGVGPSRPGHVRRGSFLSSILRRKKDPASKISRDFGESAARRDTKLERNKEALSVIRSNSNPRAQMRGKTPSWPLPVDGELDDGNLAGGGARVADDIRPSTANGPVSAVPARRAVLQRRSTSQGVVGLANSGLASSAYEPEPLGNAATVTSLDHPYKKKKFGTLRKMFGLHD